VKRLIVLVVLMATGAFSILIAQAQQDPAAIRLEKVKDALYIITGGQQAGSVSGNTTVFVTGTGVVLVDTKYPGYGKAILYQVRSVTPKPVTMIINTYNESTTN